MRARLCRGPLPYSSWFTRALTTSPSPPLVIALTGCTAAGKSRVAAEVAAKIGGELVSVDSVKLYRGFDVGSNKATLLRHAADHGVPTHLVDVASPTEPWTAGDFAREARRLIINIHSRGRIPVLVGGTSLYLDAVLGAVPLTAPPRDLALSQDIEAELAPLSWEDALARLAAIDPVRASQLNRNDRVRLVRALEIARATTSSTASTPSFPPPPDPSSVRAFVISSSPRITLYRLSDERCERMLRSGLVSETFRALKTHALSLTSEHLTRGPFSAIGYSHVISVLSAPSPPTRADTKNLVTTFMADTRHLARRQVAWWRRERIPLVWSDSHSAALVREVIDASAMDADAWQRYVRSEAVQARNAHLRDESEESRRELRTYSPQFHVYNESTDAGRAALAALHKELTKTYSQIHASAKTGTGSSSSSDSRFGASPVP